VSSGSRESTRAPDWEVSLMQHALMRLYQLLEEYSPAWYSEDDREMAEVSLTRFEASLRASHIGQGVHQFGDLWIDLGRMEVRLRNKPIQLTTREFQLLHYLAERAGIDLTRVELLRSVWGYAAGSLTRTLDVHIASLRKKLEEDPGSPQMIITIPGIGYRFNERTHRDP
jgi:DNA-binding response OmpR family regulator